MLYLQNFQRLAVVSVLNIYLFQTSIYISGVSVDDFLKIAKAIQLIPQLPMNTN